MEINKVAAAKFKCKVAFSHRMFLHFLSIIKHFKIMSYILLPLNCANLMYIRMKGPGKILKMSNHQMFKVLQVSGQANI